MFNLIPVKPIGISVSRAFVDGVDAAGKRFGRLQEIAMDDYPESPQGRGFTLCSVYGLQNP